MKTLLKLSTAFSLALHATVLLVSNPDRQLSNRQIASELCVSEAHLSKVLQRLTKVGLVKSMRGPKGGFMLGKEGDKISFLDIYEAIEGRLVLTHCLLGTQVCRKNK
ncbi:RrF2 family transcriptional regulator, partial [Candidatus Latescibacterota bacterium]